MFRSNFDAHIASFKTIYERNIPGKIVRVFGNFAFLKLENNRELFVHMKNVLISIPNLKIGFTEQLMGLETNFDIALDEVINKPTAINLRLRNGLLLDSLSIWGPQPAERLLPYSPPKSCLASSVPSTVHTNVTDSFFANIPSTSFFTS